MYEFSILSLPYVIHYKKVLRFIRVRKKIDLFFGVVEICIVTTRHYKID